MTRVSIILPIYNIKEKYLEKSILSLCNQTYQDIEILLVNDGSDAYVEEVCLELKKKDERLRYIPIEHSGVSIARNIGLDNASGEYIAYVDPDDWVDENYIEVLVYAIKQMDTDLIITNCKVNFESKEEKNDFLKGESRILTEQEKENLQLQLLNKTVSEYYPPYIAAGVPWSKLFKKSFLIENHLQFEPHMVRMQDNLFSLYAYEKAKKIGFIPSNLYHYRMNQDSISHRFNSNIIENFEFYYDKVQEFIKDNQKGARFEKALQMKELTSFNSYLSYYFFHEDYEGESKALLNQLVQKEPYKTALQSIDYSLLNTQEKIFVYLLKHRRWGLLKFLVKIRNQSRI